MGKKTYKVYVMRMINKFLFCDYVFSSLEEAEEHYYDICKGFCQYVIIISFNSYYNVDVLNHILEERDFNYLFGLLNDEDCNADGEFDEYFNYVIEKEYFKGEEIKNE